MKSRYFLRYRSALILEAGVFAVIAVLTFLSFLLADTMLEGPESGYRPFAINPSELGTVVMYAGGYGYREPEVPEGSALEDFLWQRRDALSPEMLPEDPVLSAPSSFCLRHQYLLSFLGMLWRIFGIDWRVFRWMMAFFFFLSAVFSYICFRQILSRAGSLTGVILFVFSPLVWSQLFKLRDFSKMPFIIGIVMLLFIMLRRRRSLRHLAMLCAAMGVLTGVGLGFRNDMAVFIFPVTVAIIFCPMRRPGINAASRALLLLLFITGFAVCSHPVRNSYSESGNPSDDIMLGLSTSIDKNLGLEPGSYKWIYTKHDDYVLAFKNACAMHVLHDPEPVPFEGPWSERIGRIYLSRLAMDFPYDLYLRLWASVGGVTGSFYDGLRMLTDYMGWNGAVVVAAGKIFCIIGGIVFFTVIAAVRFRISYLCLFLFLYLTAYPALQFEMRHIFPLVIFSIMLQLFLVERLVIWIIRRRKGRERKPGTLSTAFRGILMFWGGVGAMTLLVLLAAAFRQGQQVHGIAEELRALELEEVATEAENMGDWTMYRPADWDAGMPDLTDLNVMPFRFRYCAVQVAAPLDEVEFWILYEGSSIFIEFPDRIRPAEMLQSDSGLTYFFPVLESTGSSIRERWSRFSGIAFPAGEAHQFRGLYLADADAAPSLLMSFALPDDSEALKTREKLCLLSATGAWEPYIPAFDPAFPQLSNSRAGMALMTGNYDTCLALLDSDSEDSFYAAMLRGDACLKLGRIEDTLKAYEKALAFRPDCYAPYPRISGLFHEYEYLGDLCGFWKEKTREYPDHFRPWRWLGRALVHAGHYDEALDVFDKAHRMAEENPEVLADYVPLLLNAGRIEEAADLCADALDRDPGNPLVLMLKNRISAQSPESDLE